MPNPALSKHVTDTIKRRERALSVPDRHMLRIARDSMRMSCAGVAIMGGPNHYAAAHQIERLTGQIVSLEADCICKR